MEDHIKQIGAEVYWNDPDDGIYSGYREIKAFVGETIVFLEDEDGSVTEAFITELT